MKKCSSCTKDLPDAALHCVFCGAKQAPAPVAAPSAAKTVMGYQAGDMIEQLKAAQAQAANKPATPATPATPAAPAPAPAPTQIAPPSPAMVPTAGAQAKTMFASGPPPGVGAASSGLSNQPQPGTALGVGASGPSAPSPYTPPASYTPPAPAPAPLPANPAPIPSYNPNFGTPASAPSAAPVPQYLASNTAAQAGRPIEPWKDGLRLMMFIWGAVLLVAFVLPVSTSPMVFSWDAIIHAPGRGKVMPLIIAASGLLAIVFAAMPLATAPRGVLALVLGLAGIVAPLFLGSDVPGWGAFTSTAGLMALFVGLLLREEYQDALLPRLLVTFGVLLALASWVVPRGGHVPLVSLFEMIGKGSGEAKITAALVLVYVALLIVSFLVWLPAPGSGGAKILMWLLIAWPAVEYLVGLALTGAIGHIPDAPAAALWWASGAPGGSELAGVGMPVAFSVLLAYGGASVLGKTLE